jgi:hypothetical protein
MNPKIAPIKLGVRTKGSFVMNAHDDHISDAMVPMNDKRNGIYLTDRVSITVFTAARGAPYMTILESTAKTPKNFQAPEGDKNKAINTIILVTMNGVPIVLRSCARFSPTLSTYRRKINTYMNSTTQTKMFTGKSSDFPGVTLAYDIHRIH